jgi:hypothetical protein
LIDACGRVGFDVVVDCANGCVEVQHLISPQKMSDGELGA